MCMKWLDTDQEKKIDVGVSWPYDKLEPYECLISSDFTSRGVVVGDKIIVNLLKTDFWNSMAM